jgi:predicted pyridoxine 5'-phosphate oxidase superfamily flavin-nucleotide-binding protein
MTSASPFHAGEQTIQERLGVRDIEAWARRVVRTYLPEEHRAFYSALPFLVAAARDASGRPWATLLVGPEGFVSSPEPRSLVIDAKPVPGDALEGALGEGADLGLLGIEFATRRRNRLNGRVAADVSGALVCSVDQSFGNCPAYIREREWRRVEDEPPRAHVRGRRLTSRQRAWISEAYTLFIASGYRGDGESATFGMDASHRGGDPGFVRVDGDTRLVFPDYAGNNHFNTTGNLVLDPRCLFVDS